MSIEQIVKEKKAKAKRKNFKNITTKANKEKRRKFVNYTCSKCKREYHIQVNRKEAWEEVDLKKHICPICSATKIRRI